MRLRKRDRGRDRERERERCRERQRISFKGRKELKDCICLVKKFIVKGQRIFLI